MARQHGRNYTFFDAPVALFFTIDRDLELGSWMDYGMFLQSIMLAARGFGLETCAQAAFLKYHDTVMSNDRRAPGADVRLGHVAGLCRPGRRG